MAMTKPIGLKKSSFDATQDSTFYFTSSGGNQVIGNRLVIRNQTTNEEMYNDYIDTFQFAHTLPSYYLYNGGYYNFYFITYGADGEESAPSDAIPFYCYSEPYIEFDLYSYSISTSIYDFQFTYYQNEGEALDKIVLYLYDSFGNLLTRSKEIYSTEVPPINLHYTFDGFEDGKTYRIKAVGSTINGAIFENEISFEVRYHEPITFNEIEVTNDCNNGYVKIVNNLIAIDGKTNMELVEPYSSVDINNRGQYVKWDENFELGQKDFTLSFQFRTYDLGEIIRLSENSRTYYSIVLSQNKSETYSWSAYRFEIFGYENGTLKVHYVSSLFNGNETYLFNARIRYVNNEWFVFCNSLTGGSLGFHWNGELPSGSGYYPSYEHMNTTLGNDAKMYYENTINNLEPTSPLLNNPIFVNIKEITLKNGKFEIFAMTRNVTDDISSMWYSIYHWDYDTVLLCDFENNISGGNVDFILENVSSALVKRRKVGEFEWTTIHEHKITKLEDLTFTYYDCMCPTGEEFQWAIVPILNGVEGNYIMKNCESKFNGCFIYDKTAMFKTYAEVQYSSNNSIQEVGQYITLKGKYPIIIRNSEVDYEKGTISFMVTSKTFDAHRIIDKKETMELKNEIIKFLKNGMSKIWKDWNGNIKLIQVIGNPSINYNNEYGMGKINVSFEWVEQGKWDKEEDLRRNDLI